MITTAQFEEALSVAINEEEELMILPEDPDNDESDPDEVVECLSFETAGMLTNNGGLVVTMTDGSEWQIIIIKSKEGVR